MHRTLLLRLSFAWVLFCFSPYFCRLRFHIICMIIEVRLPTVLSWVTSLNWPDSVVHHKMLRWWKKVHLGYWLSPAVREESEVLLQICRVVDESEQIFLMSTRDNFWHKKIKWSWLKEESKSKCLICSHLHFIWLTFVKNNWRMVYFEA